MRSRAARLTLLGLFVVAVGATVFLYWKGERLARSEAAALRSFEELAHQASRAVLAMRAAQQAYVAQGQAGEIWPGKVAAAMDSARRSLAALRAQAASPDAIRDVESALGSLDDFAQLDRRARSYTGTGQNLLASDLIFGDGLQITGALDSRIEGARRSEVGTREAAIATFRSRQAFALTAAAAAAILVVLLLLPPAEAARPFPLAPAVSSTPFVAATDSRAVEAGAGNGESWSPAIRPPLGPRAEPPVEPESPRIAAVESGAATAGPAAAARTDFRGVARLCSDLARVIDTHQLPSLLDRASTLLDAKGIILWIADSDGRELNPVVAHGYAPQLIDRLGTIPREAENATAAAFRTELLQTVSGSEGANGAIAAPLVTGGGCVGVMAAEVANEAEREESRLAAAAIVAAQLATLVGPPAKTQGRAEVAGA